MTSSERNDVRLHSMSSQDGVQEEIYDANRGRRRQGGAAENGGFLVDEMGGGNRRRYADSEEFVFHRDRFEYSKSESVYMKGTRGYGGQSSLSRDSMLDFGEHVLTDASFSRIDPSRIRLEDIRVDGAEEMRISRAMSSKAVSVPEFRTTWSLISTSRRRTPFQTRQGIGKGKVLRREHGCDAYLVRRLTLQGNQHETNEPIGGRTDRELKLRISRDLRNLLSIRDENPLAERCHRTMRSFSSKPSRNKEEIAAWLIQACEECKELLVKAGRKYRPVLSIDRDDIRALYNWGLALSFRAQLNSDIGPESAADADKVVLAAIDKFDAMLSRGNAYAPDALFRWGVVLQQRSRLQLRTSDEKVKLLKQARRLYEDALDMDSENPRVREALSICMLELNDDSL